MLNSEYLKDLNKAQKEAVNHIDGPLLIVAGAGSGKTKVLTSRIANIIKEKKAYPNQILAVTFTNKAAREMRERLEIILSKALSKNRFGQPWSTLGEFDQNQLRAEISREKLKDLWIGTFHSLFSRLLRFDIDKYQDLEGLSWNKQFSIYDETDSQTLIKEIITQEMNLDPKQYLHKKIKWAISNAKNKCLTLNELE